MDLNQSIPKILIQTWKTKDNFPENYLPAIEDNRRIMDCLGFDWLIFDDDDVDRFVFDNYNEYWEIYDQASKIQRLDFWRYLAVYHFGGFYLDIDASLTSNFELVTKYLDKPIVQVDRDLLWTFTQSFDQLPEYGQFFFGFPQRSPLLWKVIVEVSKSLQARPFANLGYYQEVLKTTGPGAFTRALWPCRSELQIFRINTFAQNLCMGSWMSSSIDRGPFRLIFRKEKTRYTEI